MTKYRQQTRQSLGTLERTKAHAIQKITLACFLLFAPPAFAGQWETIAAIPGLEYLPDSAHRIGSHVYLVHRNTPREGGPNFVIANEVDCENQALRISWADASLGNVKGRYYNEGKSPDHYATSNFKAGETDKVFFDWACKLPLQPERLVNVREQGETLTQVDIGSVTREGAMATLWMRHDYPTISFDPPYSAPFDSKREFVEINCHTSRYRVLVGYDFMPDGAVTDGMVAPDGEGWELTGSDSYAAAKEIACETTINPRSFVGIGGDTIRPKASSLAQPSLRE
ncbi:surface-adhesin E family protein [Rhizobium ruizarguesonis]|uniref:surface-adhesin E family protein n=1 Tax=Rhizobium ruizarguesonis TaxID=2081791 RepID=UPI001FEF52C4|nr:surface-adhesin E family protein [Rhizobium ruizarguesonis]